MIQALSTSRKSDSIFLPTIFSHSYSHSSTAPLHYLALAISKVKISTAPTAVNSSMTVAIRFFSTIELTATHASSSRAVMVGARLPGVILVASSRRRREMLY